MSAFRLDKSRRAGFTLIELLIVIGIILLLVAMVVTVGLGVSRQSEVRETQNIMRLLDIAVQEWELGSDRQVLYGINGQPCVPNPAVSGHERYELQQIHPHGYTWPSDMDAIEDAEYATDRLWAILSRTTTVREVIQRVDPNFVVSLDDGDLVLMHANDLLGGAQPSFRFLDSWDNPIFAVLPGRVHNAQCVIDGPTGYWRDDDGTIRTPFENRFGVAADRRIYFVSAGPNGQFGNLHLNIASSDLTLDQRDDIADAEDNIYSYPVHIDQARPQP